MTNKTIEWLNKYISYLFLSASNGLYAVINLPLFLQAFCCACLWHCLCITKEYVLPNCRSISSYLSIYIHIYKSTFSVVLVMEGLYCKYIQRFSCILITMVWTEVNFSPHLLLNFSLLIKEKRKIQFLALQNFIRK